MKTDQADDLASETAMLSMNKILAPVDFSKRSTAAAEHAVVMADHFGSELIFAHVIPFSPYHYEAFESGLPARARNGGRPETIYSTRRSTKW